MRNGIQNFERAPKCEGGRFRHTYHAEACGWGRDGAVDWREVECKHCGTRRKTRMLASMMLTVTYETAEERSK